MPTPDLDATVRFQLDQSEAALDAPTASMAALVAGVGETTAWSSTAVHYAAQVTEAGPTHLAALASVALIRLARRRPTRGEAAHIAYHAARNVPDCDEPGPGVCMAHLAMAVVDALIEAGVPIDPDPPAD